MKRDRFLKILTAGILLGTSFLVWFTTPSLAQRGGATPEARAEQRVAVWKSQLHLSEDQEKQVRSIMLERERQWQTDHEKLLAAEPAQRPSLRVAMQAHMQSYRDRLHSVLTPEQQRTALKLREMRPMRSYRGGGMGPRGMRSTVPIDSTK